MSVTKVIIFRWPPVGLLMMTIYINNGGVYVYVCVTHLLSHLSVLSPSSEREQRFILLLITHSAYHDDYECQDYKEVPIYISSEPS